MELLTSWLCFLSITRRLTLARSIYLSGRKQQMKVFRSFWEWKLEIRKLLIWSSLSWTHSYREKAQGCIELTNNPLNTTVYKVLHLLNDLHSKKYIQAGQLDEMTPKQDKVTLGYLYFISKAHKVRHLAWFFVCFVTFVFFF